MEYILLVFAFFGMILSMYALYVEHKAATEDGFEAFCDISDEVSCSKVFLSEYGRIFSHLGLIPKDSVLDQPNAFFGVVFYLLFSIISVGFSKSEIGKLLLLAMSSMSMLLSAYLAYILTDILQDKCIVCFSTYICNISLFIGSIILSKRKTQSK